MKLSKYIFPFSFLCTLIFLLFLSFTYYQHATTFSFVDEFMNIVAAYFITKGRVLYSDIFFHHQILTPYISLFIQFVFHPHSLYQNILYHRLFVILFAFVMDIFLIYRFKYIGIIFSLFFETLKYYLFGNLFLAESFVIYPMVYLLGLAWESTKKQKLHFLEVVLVTICTWFTIFMREPFIPLATGLYLWLLYKGKNKTYLAISLIIFAILSLLLLSTINIKDYIFQVFTINITSVVPGEVKTGGAMYSFINSLGYYVVILFAKQWNIYSTSLALIDIIFISSILYLLYKKHNYVYILSLLLLLSLANIRAVTPGIIFYVAYHAIVWMGMFCFTLGILLKEVLNINKQLGRYMIIFLGCVFTFLVFNPHYYIWNTINREESFVTNYGRYYINGEIINILSKPHDTLFVDFWDTLIYWQANLPSSYKYAMYLPVTNSIPIFSKERLHMFTKNIPDFYYTDCQDSTFSPYLPKKVRFHYMQLYHLQKPTCIYIKKEKAATLSKAQLSSIEKLGYSLPLAKIK